MIHINKIDKKCNDVGFEKACIKSLPASILISNVSFSCDITEAFINIRLKTILAQGICSIQIMDMADYNANSTEWITIGYTGNIDANSVVNLSKEVTGIVSGNYAVRLYNYNLVIYSNAVINVVKGNC